MRRFVIGVGLCLALLALVVGFGVGFNGTPVYPDAGAIDRSYDAHVGERVHLWTVVTDERDGAVVVAVDGLRLELSAPSRSAVDPGDRIQVHGELRPDRRMEVRAYHVQTPGDRLYMYGVSIGGLALTADAFRRRWRIDRDRLRFVPRDDG